MRRCLSAVLSFQRADQAHVPAGVPARGGALLSGALGQKPEGTAGITCGCCLPPRPRCSRSFWSFCSISAAIVESQGGMTVLVSGEKTLDGAAQLVLLTQLFPAVCRWSLFCGPGNAQTAAVPPHAAAGRAWPCCRCCSLGNRLPRAGRQLRLGRDGRGADAVGGHAAAVCVPGIGLGEARSAPPRSGTPHVVSRPRAQAIENYRRKRFCCCGIWRRAMWYCRLPAHLAKRAVTGLSALRGIARKSQNLM